MEGKLYDNDGKIVACNKYKSLRIQIDQLYFLTISILKKQIRAPRYISFNKILIP